MQTSQYLRRRNPPSRSSKILWTKTTKAMPINFLQKRYRLTLKGLIYLICFLKTSLLLNSRQRRGNPSTGSVRKYWKKCLRIEKNMPRVPKCKIFFNKLTNKSKAAKVFFRTMHRWLQIITISTACLGFSKTLRRVILITMAPSKSNRQSNLKFCSQNHKPKEATLSNKPKINKIQTKIIWNSLLKNLKLPSSNYGPFRPIHTIIHNQSLLNPMKTISSCFCHRLLFSKALKSSKVRCKNWPSDFGAVLGICSVMKHRHLLKPLFFDHFM